MQFGSKLDKTLTRNFYVDDLLESKSDIQSTTNHIKAVTEMHKEGGSKLARFLRNSTKVLKSLQENQRRIGSKMLIRTLENCPLRECLEFSGT